ncbi:mCG146262 [Mus musculus]|nr:mCG146262 [Mus musculus]
MPIHSENVVHIHNGILFSYKDKRLPILFKEASLYTNADRYRAPQLDIRGRQWFPGTRVPVGRASSQLLHLWPRKHRGRGGGKTTRKSAMRLSLIEMAAQTGPEQRAVSGEMVTWKPVISCRSFPRQRPTDNNC